MRGIRVGIEYVLWIYANETTNKISGCKRTPKDRHGNLGNKKARRTGLFVIFYVQSDKEEWNFGAQKRTRTSTPFRVPAPEAGASTNSAIWATESDVRGWPLTVNWVFEVFLTVGEKAADHMQGSAEGWA